MNYLISNHGYLFVCGSRQVRYKEQGRGLCGIFSSRSGWLALKEKNRNFFNILHKIEHGLLAIEKCTQFFYMRHVFLSKTVFISSLDNFPLPYIYNVIGRN